MYSVPKLAINKKEQNIKVLVFPHLFSRVRWQIEYKEREEGYSDAGDNDVNGVEEGLSSQFEEEHNVRIRLLATGIVLLVSLCLRRHYVPLGGDIILLEVHPHVDYVVVAALVDVTKVNLSNNNKNPRMWDIERHSGHTMYPS